MLFTLRPNHRKVRRVTAKAERHRREGDEGGAQAQQEEQQDHGDHDRPLADGPGEVADGAVDEVALAEQHGGLDARGQGGAQFRRWPPRSFP
jgi:hypothetical protein